MERKNIILFNVSVMFLAVTVILGASQPAFAQFTGFQQNFVHATFADPTGAPGIPLGVPVQPVNFGFDQQSPFPLFNHPPVIFCDPLSFTCQIDLPNLVDDLDKKMMLIDINFIQIPAPPQLQNIDAQCFDTVTGQFSPGIIHTAGPDPQNPFSFIIEIWCEPNPDWEQIFLTFNTPSEIQDIGFIEIWTETFNERIVGGSFVPIDQSALLLAGVQSISMWMIPVLLAGAGVGLFVIKRRN